ncbi:MAG: phage scaffolding protein [Eubacteriales bacterium]|nr:phage scaffolding protein [Eubacteriales bacterium]
MKTEFLEGLLKENGVPEDKVKDLIDKVMAENGKDIEKHKGEAETAKTSLSQTKTQLDEANKQIEGFKGMDVEAIKASADKYKADFEKAQADHKVELDKIAYGSAAERFIDALKPKDGLSKSAILAEFTKKEFKLDGDSFQGAKEWGDQFKKDNAAHFSDTAGTPVSTGGDHGNPLDGDVDKFVAAAMKGAGIASEKEK